MWFSYICAKGGHKFLHMEMTHMCNYYTSLLFISCHLRVRCGKIDVKMGRRDRWHGDPMAHYKKRIQEWKKIKIRLHLGTCLEQTFGKLMFENYNFSGILTNRIPHSYGVLGPTSHHKIRKFLFWICTCLKIIIFREFKPIEFLTFMEF